MVKTFWADDQVCFMTSSKRRGKTYAGGWKEGMWNVVSGGRGVLYLAEPVPKAVIAEI